MAKRKSAEQVRELLKGVAADRAKGLTVGQACRKQGVSEASCPQCTCVRVWRFDWSIHGEPAGFVGAFGMP